MNAPRYIQKNIISQHQKDQEYKNHMKRLQDIKTKRSKTLQSNTSSSLDLKSKQQMRFLKQQMVKLNVINKENEVLLGRLVDINQGKSKRFVQDASEEQVFKIIQKKADVSDIQRKIQDQKIKEENTQLVKRLVERIQKNEQMSKDQRQRAISEYLKQRKLMQKYNNYQAEPSRLNLSTNENNLSTEHNENSRQMRGNHLHNHEGEQGQNYQVQSGELKLPPLLDQKNHQIYDNDTSQRSYSSKQVLKNGQKNSIQNGISSNNMSLNSGSGNKYSYHHQRSNENNTAANSSNSTITNKRLVSNSTNKYEYIEQNSAMYHYEDKNNQGVNQKSNSSHKRNVREKNILNNILSECYPKSEQGKSLNSIDHTKSASMKNSDGQTGRLIQTNESQENMNVSKLKNSHITNKSHAIHSLNTQEDNDSNNPSYGVHQPLKINNTISNSNKYNKQQQSHSHRQNTQKSNNNTSLVSMSNNNHSIKNNQNKNSTTVGQPISNKQQIPLNQIRSSSERIDLDVNQKIYKDKRRVSTNVLLAEKGYEGEPQKVSVKNLQLKEGQVDQRTIISKRNSAQVVDNEEITNQNQQSQNKLQERENSQYQQDFEAEEDEIKTEKDINEDSVLDKQQKNKSINQSYNFYNSNSQSISQSPEKSKNRYQQDSKLKLNDEEIVVDEDHDFDL